LADITGMGASNLGQFSPLLLDLQTHFLQVQALANTDDLSSQSVKEIRLLSRHALAIIDYAVFAIDCTQTELPLTTVSAAAIAQNVASDLQQLAKTYNVDLDLDITKKLEPVFANESAMKGALYSLASSLITGVYPLKKRVRIVIAAQETAPTTQRLGVYSPDIMISPSAIKLARTLAGGKARAVVPSQMSHSGLGLVVSDQLTRALGSPLRRFTHRDQKGIGFYVPMSPQLSFI